MEQILYDWICTWFLTISKVSLLNAGFYSLSTRIKFFVIACEFGMCMVPYQKGDFFAQCRGLTYYAQEGEAL